jgi:hypothetical protein
VFIVSVLVVEELPEMSTIGYLVPVYMVFGVLLVLCGGLLYERLKRYIDIKYPEEGKIIRLYECQRYPWSLVGRTLRALVKKQSNSDPELTIRAKMAKWSVISFLAWFVLGLIVFLFASFFLCEIDTAECSY